MNFKRFTFRNINEVNFFKFHGRNVISPSLEKVQVFGAEGTKSQVTHLLYNAVSFSSVYYICI